MSDSGLLSPAWADTDVADLLADRAWVQAMLDVEVALAAAQARVGVVPRWAVPVIREAARADRFDLTALTAGVRATGNPVVSLVAQLTAAVDRLAPPAAEYVHRGSTSQDILDSAMMLMCRRVFHRVDEDLVRCADTLADLAVRHRGTVMVGRTLTQHAVPMTFGLKAATWLAGVLDGLQRLRHVRLPVSLGGAAGTLAAYAEYARMAGAQVNGYELVEPFAAELGLDAPVLPWHGVRTPLADVAGVLCTVTGVLGKVAVDVQVLTRTEIGELAEAAAPGRGASSAMPQKRNPVFATAIATAARQLPPAALVLFQSMAVEDERSAGGWHAEWQPLRECLRMAAGAARNAAELVTGLVVSPERMRRNLELTGAGVVSERLSAVLAPVVGRTTSKRMLTAAVVEAGGSGRDLVDVLTKALRDAGHDDVVGSLAGWVDPTGYLGASDQLVDRVVRRHREVRRAGRETGR